jgi:Protein of unknown function (DUF2690)
MPKSARSKSPREPEPPLKKVDRGAGKSRTLGLAGGGGMLALLVFLSPLMDGAEKLTNVANGVVDLLIKINILPESKPTSSQSQSASAAPTLAELAGKYDGGDPEESGCSKKYTELATFPMVKPGSSREYATAEVLYSPSCKTAWVHVFNTLEGLKVLKYIERRATDSLSGKQESTPFDVTTDIKAKPIRQHSYTMQLYVPAGACVLVRVELTKASGTLVGEVPLREVCVPSG